MSQHRHRGHETLVDALARAHREETLPAALLFYGPKGVGKQHLALWLGRLLLCSDPGPDGPCDSCKSCKLAGKLEHPDLHWYFPLSRPKNASSPEKLAQALEDARGERLQELRTNPLQPLGHTEARTLYLAAARSLRKKAFRRPSMGPGQVFIIAEAEALAPQGTSSEAANALLKLLEEPPAGTTLILTSAEPGRLLPTIRSRTTQIHLPPLSSGEVHEFLLDEAQVDEDTASRAAGRAGGSIGRALGFLDEGEDPGPLEQIRRQALELLSAAVSEERGGQAVAALGFKPVGARGLRDLFSFLEESLEELARVASGLPLRGAPEAEARFLQEAVDRWGIQPSYLPPALEHVDRARVLAEGNVNPQLVIFGLLHELRRELVRGVHGYVQGR